MWGPHWTFAGLQCPSHGPKQWAGQPHNRGTGTSWGGYVKKMNTTWETNHCRVVRPVSNLEKCQWVSPESPAWRCCSIKNFPSGRVSVGDVHTGKWGWNPLWWWSCQCAQLTVRIQKLESLLWGAKEKPVDTCSVTTLMKGLVVVSSSGSPSNSLSWTALLSKMAMIGMKSQHWFGWVDEWSHPQQSHQCWFSEKR